MTSMPSSGVPAPVPVAAERPETGRHRAAAQRAREGTGAPPLGRTAFWAIVAVLAALGSAAAYSSWYASQGRAVQPGVIGFSVSSPKQIQLHWALDKAPLAEAVCVLRAQSQDTQVVGRLTVTVGPRSDNKRETVRTDTIPTSARAITAGIESCTITRTR